MELPVTTLRCCARLILPAFLGAAAVLAAGRSLHQSQTKPTFRAGIDVVELDVSVLDKAQQPVEGLTAADFTVLEDKKPQAIVAFAPVHVRDAAALPATWMRDVSPDVTTNSFDEKRVVILALDDATIVWSGPCPPAPATANAPRGIGGGVNPGSGRTGGAAGSPCPGHVDLGAVAAVKASAHLAIDKLGPDDVAAVVFTGDGRQAQDFTTDHASLHAAVERFGAGFDPTCHYFQGAIDTLRMIAKGLADLPQRRKLLLFISGGAPVNMGNGMFLAPMPDSTPKACGAIILDLMKEVFREAALANVTIDTIDPFGTHPMALTFLQALADNTGGRAIAKTKNFEAGLAEVFRENASYYLIGFRSTNTAADGSLRHLEVKVNRPALEVRTRKSYYARSATPTPGPPTMTSSVAGILPNAGVPLQVVVTPFAAPGSQDTALAIVLGVGRPSDATDERADDVDLGVSAFTPDGLPRGSAHSVAEVGLTGPPGGPLQYEVLSRLDLPPGRYELRLALHSSVRQATGSVYASVTVPDFTKAALSLSGVALSLAHGATAAPADLLEPVLPIVPTSQREFQRSDRVTAFVRVYEGGSAALAPATLHTRILNEKDEAVADETATIDAAAFAAATRSADHRFDVPLMTLAPGDYVLIFESATGTAVARKDVRFTVK